LVAGLASEVAASMYVNGQINCTNGSGAANVLVKAYCAAGPCTPILTTGYTDASGHFGILVENCPFCAFDPYYFVELLGQTIYRPNLGGSSWYVGEFLVGCGGNCFLEGTRITMADGSTKPIETITKGDMILAFDEDSGTMKPDRVSLVHAPVVENGYYKVNDRIRATRSHPVLSKGKWVEIADLRLGDTLTGADGKPEIVTKLELVQEKIQVFNFSVNPFETFVADGIIVHNKTPPSNPTEHDD